MAVPRNIGSVLWMGIVLLAMVLASCTDADQVNAAFRQSRVGWYLFDPGTETGLRPLSGFDQSLSITWKPLPRVVRATALLPLHGDQGAVAVSSLGLLILDDHSGTLEALRPQARINLAQYLTDRLFVWDGRVFVTLSQEAPLVAPPATLAWWSPGQNRIALYPLPSQVKDPSRQAVAFSGPSITDDTLTITWKYASGPGWRFDHTRLSLSGGVEEVGESASAPVPAAPVPTAPAAKIAERLGSETVVMAGLGSGPPLAFTADGWVAVTSAQDGRTRLFRLPELGPAGHYTGALALGRSWVFSWQVDSRGYGGAAGLVAVPWGVLH